MRGVGARARRHPGIRTHQPSAICAPERFRLAIETAVAMRRGRLGGYVMVLAWTLVKLARYSGSLSPSEIGEVNQLYKRLGNKRSAERPQDVDRDDLLLGQLDDPRVLDALLSHPSRTVETVLKSKKQTRAAALEVQKACVLELWLCAPLRLTPTKASSKKPCSAANAGEPAANPHTCQQPYSMPGSTTDERPLA